MNTAARGEADYTQPRGLHAGGASGQGRAARDATGGRQRECPPGNWASGEGPRPIPTSGLNPANFQPRQARDRAQAAPLDPLTGRGCQARTPVPPFPASQECLKIPEGRGRWGAREGAARWQRQPRLERPVQRSPPGIPRRRHPGPATPHTPRAGSPGQQRRRRPAPTPRPGRPPVPRVDPAGPAGVVVDVEDLAVVVPGLLPAPG